VSTILRSLKKLEKEKQSHIDPVPAPGLISSTGAHQAIHRAVQLTWIKSRIVQWSIVGVACLIVVAGLYTFSQPAPQAIKITAPPTQIIQPVQKSLGPKRSVQPRPADVPPPASVAKETSQARPDAFVPVPAQDFSKPKPMAEASPVVPLPARDGFQGLGHKPAPSTMGATPVQKHNRIDRDGTRPAVGPASGPASIAAPVAAVAPAQQAFTPAASPPTPREPPQSQPTSAKQEAGLYANAERMTNGALKVQAIVFAPAAAERMAVVNNNIVREGSAIDKYTIIGIGQEAIYVREGQGRLLKVPFGKP
jgi:hypothetical protein